jgi:hypothetical protein
MTRKPSQKPDDSAQYQRFLEAAKKAQADDTKESADRAFKKVTSKPSKERKGRSKKPERH